MWLHRTSYFEGKGHSGKGTKFHRFTCSHFIYGGTEEQASKDPDIEVMALKKAKEEGVVRNSCVTVVFVHTECVSVICAATVCDGFF